MPKIRGFWYSDTQREQVGCSFCLYLISVSRKSGAGGSFWGTYLVIEAGRSRALAVAEKAKGPGLVERCPVCCVHPQCIEDHAGIACKDGHYLAAVPAAKTILQCLQQQSGHFSDAHPPISLVLAAEKD